MTSWYEQFDSVFFLTAGTIIVGVLGLCARLCYKSKCQKINICYGALLVERATQDEIPDPDVDSGVLRSSPPNTPSSPAVRAPTHFSSRNYIV